MLDEDGKRDSFVPLLFFLFLFFFPFFKIFLRVPRISKENMKPGFVHSCFLLIYLRLSKPIYFPSRYHRKDKSKNLVYNSVKRSFVNNSINCTVSFTYIYNIYIYMYFFLRILFSNRQMNFFGQPFPTLLPTSAIFLHFFF